MVADLPQPWPILIGRYHCSGLTLNRFGHHSGDFVPHRLGCCQSLLNSIGVPERDMAHTV